MAGPRNDIEARQTLELFTQANVEPKLTDAELDQLLLMARVTDIAGIAPDYYQYWLPLRAYVTGDYVVPVDRNGFIYVALSGGTTGSTEPDWPTTLAQTVVDGTVTWSTAIQSQWTYSMNLAAVIAEGWEIKAGKAVPRYDVEAGSVNAKRSQIFRHCKDMAKRYRSLSGGGGMGSVALTTRELEPLY